MTSEEKFEKTYANMQNLYEQELKEKQERAEKERKQNVHVIVKNLKIVGVLIAILFILCLIFKINFFDSSIVTLVILLILFVAAKATWNKLSVKNGIDYKNIFKIKIVNSLIKSFDSNLEYLPLYGITEIDYKNATFENYDIYQSTDLIKNTSTDTKIAYVSTSNEETDNQGEKHFYKVFRGIFIETKLEKITNLEMYIKKDIKEKNFFARLGVPKFPFEKMNIKLDSSEFEETFDVFSSDEILAMQILTADTMELLVDLQKHIKNTFEITIKDNKICIRFDSDNIFDMTFSGKYESDREILFKQYKTLEYVFDTTKKVKKIVENVI